MKCSFEWGVVTAPFLCVLSVVPRHCARLTHFLHPNLRNMNAVLIAPQRMTLPCLPPFPAKNPLLLRRLRRTVSAPGGACRPFANLNSIQTCQLFAALGNLNPRTERSTFHDPQQPRIQKLLPLYCK